MSDNTDATRLPDLDTERLEAVFANTDYVAGDEIITTVDLALQLGKPLLVEGPPGSGKTELAKVLATAINTELIRLQCYEGLTAEQALYEWNYSKQLLTVQAAAGNHSEGNDTQTESVFTREYLLERPLLKSLQTEEDNPAVLLIDEIDRADKEFEALLLEVLSDFQITVPEIGSISASKPPIVVITSNRTRGLSDALKRRCLYLHIGMPSFEKELDIIERKVPELENTVARQIVTAIQRLREEPLRKHPGVSETLDWAKAIDALRSENDPSLDTAKVKRTIGCILKEAEDIERIDDELIEQILTTDIESNRASGESLDAG